MEIAEKNICPKIHHVEKGFSPIPPFAGKPQQIAHAKLEYELYTLDLD
jgi:hypothetical protein